MFAFFFFVPISTIPLGWQQVEEVFLPLHPIPMYVPKTHHASSINVQHLTGGWLIQGRGVWDYIPGLFTAQEVAK